MSIRQAGVINNYTVIEAVGRTLAELLRTEMENQVTVTVASPGEDYGAPVGTTGPESGTSRINLFLYRIEEAPYSLNNDWVDVGEGRQIPFPLTLNLYYMLNIFTPDKSCNLEEHRILGDVIQVFHANQIIDPIYFEGTLNPNEPPEGMPWEELKIIRKSMNLEELSAIWHAINKPYRLSVAYEISVVTIASPAHKSRRIRRVDVTHVRAAPFRGRPLIRDISPDRGYAGEPITIIGENLDSTFLRVYLNDSLLEPERVTPGEIIVRAPQNLPPGLYGVRVTTEEGSSREIFFEEISPFLYRLDPEWKYTEDPEFPKNNNNDPILTIWGGNFLTEPQIKTELHATLEDGSTTPFPVDSNQLTRNSIKWVIPDSMRKGRTILRVLSVRQGVTITSNALILEIPVPKIYRITPEIVTLDINATFPPELVIVGEHFRAGATDVYLYAGISSDINDIKNLYNSPAISFAYKTENELRINLSGPLEQGIYIIGVKVYGRYYSEPYEIKVT